MSKLSNARFLPDARKAGSYDVGYARPPAQHRFRKGVSGNPSGRPRKDTRTSPVPIMQDAFAKAVQRPLHITLDGKRIKATRGDALAHQLIAQALKGDHRAAKLVLQEMRAARQPAEPAMAHEDWLDYLAAEEERRPRDISVTFVKPDTAAD